MFGIAYGILEGEEKISVSLENNHDLGAYIFGTDCWATQSGCSKVAEIQCNSGGLNAWFSLIDGDYEVLPPVLPPHELDPLHESDLIRAD
ncbi:MAG: hypothetical protein K9G70_11840 [Prolixibacteraceae bacterium]|nr:hypothetical protein [Prolixibacteraceae bacterium]